MANLLLIDEDGEMLPKTLCHLFPAPPNRVEIAKSGEEGLRRFAAVPPDIIVLDLLLPDQSGLDVLRNIRRVNSHIPGIVITPARSADFAINAIRQGAYDYLLKPLDMQNLDRVIREGLKVAGSMRELPLDAESLSANDLPEEALVGACPAIQQVYKAIGRVADHTFPVLIWVRLHRTGRFCRSSGRWQCNPDSTSGDKSPAACMVRQPSHLSIGTRGLWRPLGAAPQWWSFQTSRRCMARWPISPGWVFT